MNTIRSQRLHLVQANVDNYGPYNDYDEIAIAFSQNELNNEIVHGTIEQNLDRLNFKANFKAWMRSYGHIVAEENLSAADEKKNARTRRCIQKY